ncbi:CPBP family intramembrane glutamic endopeptidase [Bifidobacterium xylocopae]|nr:CPBP family intramembrane glutamic endopeptidase [Bifidobacterium xylocopae]
MKGRHAIGGGGHPRSGPRHAPVPVASGPWGRRQALSRQALSGLREAVGTQSVFIFLYMVAMQLVGYSVGVILIAVQGLPAGGGISFERTVANLDGWRMAELYLLSTTVAFVFMILYRRRQIADPGPGGVFRRSSRPMTFPVLLTALLLVLAAQSLSKLYDFGLIRTVGRLGETVGEGGDMSLLWPTSAALPMLLYSCLWGPVVEETVFRGAVLGALKRYGRGFAIVTTSFLFALLHGNLSQSVFAFGLGLVLGFVGCEYSLIWPIGLHVASNLAAFYLPNLVRQSLAGYGLRGAALQTGAVCFWALIAVLGALVLVCWRHRLAAFLRADRSAPNIYASWGGFWFLLVSGVQAVLIVWRLVH